MEIIIAAAVSLIVQAIKKLVGTSEFGTLAAVLVVSLIGGAAYYFLQDTAFWTAFLQILAYAGAFYTFIIRRFESKSA